MNPPGCPPVLDVPTLVTVMDFTPRAVICVWTEAGM